MSIKIIVFFFFFILPVTRVVSMEVVAEDPFTYLKDVRFHVVVQLDIPSMGCLFSINKSWYEYSKTIWNDAGSLFMNNHCLYMDLLGHMVCYNRDLFESTVKKN